MSASDWQPAASLELAALACLNGAEYARTSQPRKWLKATPVLSVAAVSDPQMESIAATRRRGERRFLQTSPEYPIERLLAAGFGDCYQVLSVFRDGESAPAQS